MKKTTVTKSFYFINEDESYEVEVERTREIKEATWFSPEEIVDRLYYDISAAPGWFNEDMLFEKMYEEKFYIEY